METWTERLARLVRDRREELGLTQEELAAAGGKNLSVATVGLIERAARENYRGLTFRALCLGLGWSADSVDRIKMGDNPRPEVFPPPHTGNRERVRQSEAANVLRALDSDGNLMEDQRRIMRQLYEGFLDVNGATRPSPEPEPEGP